MSKTVKVSDSVWKKLRAMDGSCSSNIERLLEYREIERNIKKYIDDKFSDLSQTAITERNQSDDLVETTLQETDTADSEDFNWTGLEERIATIRAQEKKVFELEDELNTLKRPINEYHNWARAAEEDKDDPVLYEDSLREAQGVLDRNGVNSIEELEEKLADRIDEVKSEYGRESKILLKMRRTM